MAEHLSAGNDAIALLGDAVRAHHHIPVDMGRAHEPSRVVAQLFGAGCAALVAKILFDPQ